MLAYNVSEAIISARKDELTQLRISKNGRLTGRVRPLIIHTHSHTHAHTHAHTQHTHTHTHSHTHTHLVSPTEGPDAVSAAVTKRTALFVPWAVVVPVARVHTLRVRPEGGRGTREQWTHSGLCRRQKQSVLCRSATRVDDDAECQFVERSKNIHGNTNP